MPPDPDREAERERLLTEISRRLPPDIGNALVNALRTRRGVNFWSDDPEVRALLAQWKALTDETEPPAN